MRPARIIVFTFTTAALLSFALWIGGCVVSTAAIAIAGLAGVDLSYSLGGWGGYVLLLAVLMLVPRDKLAWNRKYCIEGEVIINAPIEDIWDRLKLRPRTDYFSPLTRRIMAVPGAPNEFRLLFDDRMINKAVATPNHIHVRLLDEETYEYMAFHAVNADEMPFFGKDHLMTEIVLEQLLDGVRVRYLETLSRVTLGAFLALMFLNPARDAMTLLKTEVERDEIQSVMYEMLEGLQPHAPMSAVPEGRGQSAMRLVGASALVVVTIAAVLLAVPQP